MKEAWADVERRRGVSALQDELKLRNKYLVKRPKVKENNDSRESQVI